MKTILCYGDSLTWGFDAATGARTAFEKRWPNVMQGQLGTGYRVIEEALNGRTTVFDDAFMPDRNGRTMLPALLDAHRPLDLVIVLLGTNDLQPYRKLTAGEVTRGAAALLDVIVKSGAGPNNGAPQMLLIAPPPLGAVAGFMAPIFAGAEAESRKLAGLYELATQFYACQFFDAGSVVSACRTDGVHLDEPAQRKLGEAVTQVVKGILP